MLGIDFGTRNTCIGIWKGDRFEAIPDAFGNITMPSIVSFHGSCKLVGNNALAMKNISSENTIYDIKRLLGRTHDDPKTQQIVKLLDYQVNEELQITVKKVGKTNYSPI